MAYKRKYRRGEVITSLDELAKQEFIYWHNKIYHAGWFMSWQFRMAKRFIDAGSLYYAVSTADEKEDNKDADQ